MEDEYKSPNQTDEFNLPDSPNRDESIEQFEQGESTEPVEDIDQIESIVESEPNMGQKIDVVRSTKPTEPIKTNLVENIEPVKVEPVKPTENIPPVSKSEDKKPAKKGFGKKLLVILVVLILMAGSAAAAYWWRDKQANEFESAQAESALALQQQVSDLTTEIGNAANYNGDTSTFCDSADECLPVAPAASVIENIKAVINTANTQPLLGYVADGATAVTVDAGGVSSSPSNGTVVAMTNFLEKSSHVWDFNLSDLLVDSYKAGAYGKYFSDATIIGKSDNGEVIAITFDCNSKIYDILLSTSETSVH